MDIAFITSEYPPKNVGGAGISSKLIVEGLREYSHSVDVFALTGQPDNDPTEDEAGYIGLPTDLGSLLPESIEQNLSIYKHLPATSSYDVVHVYSPGHLPASLFRADVPVVATFVNFTWVCINSSQYLRRGLPEYTFLEAMGASRNQYNGVMAAVAPIVEKIGKAITARADAITVQTEGLQDILSKCGYNRSDIEVVPNIMDKRFELSIDDSRASESRRIVTVGRLVEQKGVFDIVRAFGRLPDHLQQEWSLEVYGSGPQQESIERYIESKGLSNVSLDYSPYNEMPETVYRDAAVVVHGAKWPEPFSRVWLEAMGTGTPIVCSENPSSRCVLDDVGKFYDPFDEETLRETLIEVLESPQLRHCMAESVRGCAPNYDPKEVIPRYVNLYEKIRN